jgi:2-polyprenyl-3-methyl-5-hydroxy-6-metoxy-1,4-benzoquinol methylase
LTDERLDSGRFWERCIAEAIEDGVPGKWSASVFDGDQPIAGRFLEELEPGGHVLDFGCGVGRNALALARRGFVVSVCDVADAGVRYCEERAGIEGLPIHAVGYDGREIELGNKSVDAVLAWSCLDHVTLEWAAELTRELSRVARPGAVLFVSFDEDRSDDPESTAEVLDDGTHRYVAGRREGMLFRPYTNAEIRSLFEADWDLVEWEGEDATVHRRALFRRRP